VLEQETVQRFLGELGSRLGIRLTLDEDGACAMTYGGGEQVTVVAADGTGCVILHAPVAPLPASEREAFYERVLKLNLMGAETGGCVIGLDEVDAAIVLAHVQSLRELDARGFENLLANFVERADRTRSLLADPGAAAIGRERRMAADEPTFMLQNLGMRA
jgi:hypothetical protein